MLHLLTFIFLDKDLFPLRLFHLVITLTSFMSLHNQLSECPEWRSHTSLSLHVSVHDCNWDIYSCSKALQVNINVLFFGKPCVHFTVAELGNLWTQNQTLVIRKSYKAYQSLNPAEIYVDTMLVFYFSHF